MTLMSDGFSARDALRKRQGNGARYDAPDAPHDDLLLARRGTAYFARQLARLNDSDLAAPSLRAGWSRRHLITHAGYHARALARLIESVRTGVRQPVYTCDEARLAEIELGATLPARALRSLVHHAAIHLDVEWRDLQSSQWSEPLSLLDGTQITVRDTPFIRAREVWQCAIDLSNGARAADIPPTLNVNH